MCFHLTGLILDPADAAAFAAQLSHILRPSQSPSSHDAQAQDPIHIYACPDGPALAPNLDGTSAAADLETQPHSLASLAEWLERHARTSDTFLDAVARGAYAPLGLVVRRGESAA